MPPTSDRNLIFDLLTRVNPRWLDVAERRVVKTGTTLFTGLTQAEGLLFPTDGLVALLAQAATGRKPQVGMVGSVGVTGSETLFTGRPSTVEAVVDVEVAGMWVGMAQARRIAETCEPSRAILARYLDHERAEFARWAANAAALSVSERVAAWIEEASTNLDSDLVPVSHTLIAERLGIRRASITEDLGAKIEAGALKPKRTKMHKRIDVRDGAALFEAAKGTMSVGTGNVLRLMMDLGKILTLASALTTAK